MRRMALVAAVCWSIVPGTGSAQTRALPSARLRASVAIDAHGVFVYRYTVENGAASTAAIQKVGIDISLPEGAAKPSSAGLVNGPGYFAATSPLATSGMAVDAVPVGVSAPQPGWRTTVGADAKARWIADGSRNAVLPARVRAGFSMTSHGPPGLRQFTLAPLINPNTAPVMPPGPDPGEADRYAQELSDYVESRSVAGTTLGPAAAMTPDALLAELAGEIGEARSLRWISSDSIAQSLAARLRTAREAMSRRQLEAAATALRALGDEAAAQSGRGLTSEAAALVELNVQYILRTAARPGPVSR